MSHVTQPIASRIESAVRDIPGWSPLDQLQCLFTLAFSSAHLQGDILELGSWCGRSAIVLGMAAQATGKVKVHCVDLFPEKNDWFRNADGTYSFSVQLNGVTFGAYQDQTVWEEPFLRDIAPLYERWPGTLEAFNDSVRKHNSGGLCHSLQGRPGILCQECGARFLFEPCLYRWRSRLSCGVQGYRDRRAVFAVRRLDLLR